MKKLILLAAISATALSASAQKKNAAQEIYTHLEQQEDVFTISVNKKMLESIDADVDWGDAVKYLKGDLQSVKVMLISENDSDKQLTKYIYKELKHLGYKLTDLPEEAENRKNDNETIWLFTNRKGKSFTEAHVIVESEDGSGIFVSIYGDIEVTDEIN